MTVKKFFKRKRDKRSMDLDPEDVAIVFKADGHVDLSFPELTGEQVPQHILAALAVSNAIMDDDFFEEIQEAFEEKMSDEIEETNAQEVASLQARPQLKIIS